MKLYRHYVKKDPKKIYEAVKAGYGIEHPERIGGFYGAFMLPQKDVYLSDMLALAVACSRENGNFIDDCIKRFSDDDYGFVTEWERGAYIEDKYIGGGTSWFIGRYSDKNVGSVILADLCDIIYMSFVEEDCSAIYEEHFRNSRFYREGDTVADRMINEIRYVKVRT